jgi:hypothetical protein
VCKLIHGSLISDGFVSANSLSSFEGFFACPIFCPKIKAFHGRAAGSRCDYVTACQRNPNKNLALDKKLYINDNIFNDIELNIVEKNKLENNK